MEGAAASALFYKTFSQYLGTKFTNPQIFSLNLLRTKFDHSKFLRKLRRKSFTAQGPGSNGDRTQDHEGCSAITVRATLPGKQFFMKRLHL